MTSPEGLAINPRIPESCRICCFDPRAPESAMTKIGLMMPFFVLGFEGLEHFVGDLLGDVAPDGDDFVVALAVGDRAVEVLLLNFDDFAFGGIHELGLVAGDDHVR